MTHQCTSNSAAAPTRIASGTAPSGGYVVTVTGANTFTVTSANNTTTSGNVVGGEIIVAGVAAAVIVSVI